MEGTTPSSETWEGKRKDPRMVQNEAEIAKSISSFQPYASYQQK